MDTIEAPMPDADLWLRKASVNANPAAITQAVMDRFTWSGSLFRLAPNTATCSTSQ